MIFDISPEDLKVFLDEAEEQLQIMEDEFLVLEREADNEEVLQAIFRAAHTLKGSSATLGHRPMAELTHAMENVLDLLRRRELTVSSGLIDTLFNCLDLLKAFKEEIASGEPAGIDTQAILAELAQWEAGSAPAGAAATYRASVQLTEAEYEQLAARQAAGERAYWIDVALDQTGPMPAVRAFQVLISLSEVGELFRSWPTQDEVEQDQVGAELRIVLLTKSTPEALEALIAEVPEVSLTSLAELGAKQEAVPTTRAAQATSRPTERLSVGRTVRVDVEVLDNLMNLVGELVIDRTRLAQITTILEHSQDGKGSELSQELTQTSAHIGRITAELQEEIMRARMLPVDNLFRKFPRMVRDSAQALGKEINFIIRGEDTELDRSVIEVIGDPLMHLLRNAVDHGVEAPQQRIAVGKPAEGTVVLEASHEENHIIISVRDDGKGIDPAQMRASAVRKGLLTEEAARRLTDQEAINLIFAAGFSTRDQVSDLSGRGVGMDVVHQNLEKINGAIDVTTELGKGTEFRIKLPLTLAIIRALLVEIGDAVYALPLNAVNETILIEAAAVETVRGREVYSYRGSVVPLIRVGELFGHEPPGEPPEELYVVVVNLFGKLTGLVVDNLIGEQEVVIKSLGKFIGEVVGISGATILGDGSVAMIIDAPSLVNSVIQAETQAGTVV